MSKKKCVKEDDSTMTLEEKLELEINHDEGVIERIVDEAIENRAAEKVAVEVDKENGDETDDEIR